MPRYQTKVLNLSSGQTLRLPGDAVFEQVAAIPSEIDIYTIDTVQRFPLGTSIVLNDDVYRYVEFGGTTVAGDLIQAEGPDATHDDLAAGTDGSVGGVDASFVAGSKIINISDTIALVLNEYAGGKIKMENDTGQGYSYHIESHDAPASDSLFVIKHGLAVAIDATTDIALVKSRWKEVLQTPTTLTAAVVGVSVGVGADGSFGWAHTGGIATVLTDGVVVIGAGVMPSNGTAGSVEAWALTEAAPNTEITPMIGHVVDVGPTTEYSLINLMIDK